MNQTIHPRLLTTGRVMNKKLLLLAGALLASSTPHAAAQYPGWQHEGSLFILTTPEGADLPATAAVEGFPLLVRLLRTC